MEFLRFFFWKFSLGNEDTSVTKFYTSHSSYIKFCHSRTKQHSCMIYSVLILWDNITLSKLRLLSESNHKTKVEYTHIPWTVGLFVLNLPAAAAENSQFLYTLYTFPQSFPFGSGTPRNASKHLNDFVMWKTVSKCWLAIVNTGITQNFPYSNEQMNH